MKQVKNIAVIGASGGSGKSTVEALLSAGHKVTAVSRGASKAFGDSVRCVDGSAVDKEVLRKAIHGQDAVIVTLGITENPIRVRLFGPDRTPADIRSAGTQSVIEVMQELGVKRLVVQTTFGSGPSRKYLRFIDRLFFNLLLKPQIDDTDLQDELIRQSGLDWTITQPVHLTDTIQPEDKAFLSTTNEVGNWSISRKLVGEINAELALGNKKLGNTIVVSTEGKKDHKSCGLKAVC